MNILIIGYGFVGKATEQFLRACGNDNIFIQDPALGHNPDKSILDTIDYSFVCVPSPPSSTGRFDLMHVIDAVTTAPGHVIIRSTIGPDQTAYFPGVDFLPEFLREKHAEEDAVATDMPLVYGSDDYDPLLLEVISGCKRIIITSVKTAVMFKLARNSLLASRVALANELYDICKEQTIDYNSVADLIKADKDIGGTHYDVPGHDGKRGFGGNCLPKDIGHMTTLSEAAYLLKSIYTNNRNYRDE